MEDKVTAYMKKYHMTDPGDTVIVGVSGGADSVCLLLVLADKKEELGIRLQAVHVNHQLRPEAEADEAYVKALCKQLNIPFKCAAADVLTMAEKEKMSTEEAGRILRYRIFSEVQEECAGKVKIAVAHHADDRAETVLFHLFRGSGITGLAGIRPVRENVIRPLLCVSRQEIEKYLADRKIKYCMDTTNESDDYTRNKIRHHILPYAEKEICERATEHIVQAADMLMETEELLQELTEEGMKQCVRILPENRGAQIDAAAFAAEKELIQKRMILRILENFPNGRKDITAKHVESIIGLLHKTGSKEVSLPYGIRAIKEYDRIVICRKEKEQKPKQQEFETDGLGEICLGEDKRIIMEQFAYDKTENIPQKTYTKWFDYDKIEKSLRLRTRLPGDYIMIDGGRSKKKLKEYMIEEKIPKSERDSIYLLADGEHILWVIGYRISEYYKISDSTLHVLQVQWTDERSRRDVGESQRDDI